MRSISFLMASLSKLDRGRQSSGLILRSRIMKASRKARSICSGVPATAAGSGMPVRGHRLTGAFRADFLCGVVANGEDEVHFCRTRLRELEPILATESLRW